MNNSKKNNQNRRVNRKTKPQAYRRNGDKSASTGKLSPSVDLDKGGSVKSDFANDPQWYFKSNQILADVASFSFANPLGDRFGLPRVYDTNLSAWATAVPGLLSMHIGITPGISLDAQSPMNLAATNVYTYVRYKNSGARNYDSPDLMLYLVAMDSIYACWNWLKRIYGMASTYSQLNKYMPRAYMAANNVDFDDLINNLANFRAYLNTKASEIAAFCVPATMTWNIRHSWMFSNIYKDADTMKAQQYMFVPAYFYKYSEMTSPKGGELLPVNVMYNVNPGTSTKFKVADLMSILNELLEAVNYSEDIGVMSGDILKAYGPGGLFTLSEVSADYRVEPVYSPEVLSQIENARIIDTTTTNLDQFKVVQDPDTNFIKFQPTIKNGSYSMKQSGLVLNMHVQDPSPEQVMVATRLTYSSGILLDDGYPIESCGSELVLGSYLFAMVENTNPDEYAKGTGPLTLTAVSTMPDSFMGEALTPTQIRTWLGRLVMLSSFDWHPHIPVVYKHTVGDQDVYSNMGELADWDVYTLISADNIRSLNQLALLSEFNVPN